MRRRHDAGGQRALFGKVLGEYSNDVALYVRTGVEQIGRNLLDRVAVRQELFLSDGGLPASLAGERIHGGFTDPAFDGLIAIQHQKREPQSLAIVSNNLITCERHRN